MLAWRGGSVMLAWGRSLPGHSQVMSAPAIRGDSERFDCAYWDMLGWGAESPDFILDLADYYAFFTYSMILSLGNGFT